MCTTHAHPAEQLIAHVHAATRTLAHVHTGDNPKNADPNIPNNAEDRYQETIVKCFRSAPNLSKLSAGPAFEGITESTFMMFMPWRKCNLDERTMMMMIMIDW